MRFLGSVIGFLNSHVCVCVRGREKDCDLQIAIVAQNAKWLPLFVCLVHTHAHTRSRVVAAPKIMLTKAVVDDKENKK